MNNRNEPHSFSTQILDFYFSLSSKPPLPEGVETIYPFDNKETLLQQMSFPQAKPNIICVGQGKNLKYLKAFNDKYYCFESIEVVPHPRWVMQYRRKEKQKYIEQYLDILKKSINNSK